MKKLPAWLVVFVLLAIAAAVLSVAGILPGWKKRARLSLDPSRLLPAGTLAYAEVTDFPRTYGRWQKTDLRALWQEPQVQAFAQRPQEKLPEWKQWEGSAAWLMKVKPQRAFVAVTRMEGDTSHWIAGLSFGGSRGALEALLAELRARMRQAQPAGKSDLQSYGKAEILTFTGGAVTLAETVHEGWYLASNDLEVLKAALDHFASVEKTGAGTLAIDEVFCHSIQPLPGDPELLGFIRLEGFADRLLGLAAASGQPLEAARQASIKAQRAVGFTSRIEGTEFRDTAFLYAPAAPAGPRLALAAISQTSPDTLLFYNAAVPPHLNEQLTQWPIPGTEELRRLLSGANSEGKTLFDSFGAEMSLALDWLSGPHPEVTVSIELKGEARSLRANLEKLVADGSWRRAEAGMAVVYTPKGHEAFSLALTDRFLMGGLSSSVDATLQRQAAKGPTLAGNPGWQKVVPANNAATGAVGYLNTSGLVDRAYGLARPLLAVGLAFDPAASAYIDASKLPTSAVLAKHLGSTGFSINKVAEGELIVSRGSVTLPQLVVGLGAAGVAAFPLLRDNLPAGLLTPALAPVSPGPSVPPEAPVLPAAPVSPPPAACVAPPAAGESPGGALEGS